MAALQRGKRAGARRGAWGDQAGGPDSARQALSGDARSMSPRLSTVSPGANAPQV